MSEVGYQIEVVPCIGKVTVSLEYGGVGRIPGAVDGRHWL